MKKIKTICLALLLINVFGCVETLTLSELCKKTDEDRMMTVAEWYYCGSKDQYHYFYNLQIGFGSGTYRINENELKLKQTFPVTKDRVKWILLSWGSPHPDKRSKTQALVDNETNCFDLWKIDLNNSNVIIDKENNIIQIIDNE